MFKLSSSIGITSVNRIHGTDSATNSANRMSNHGSEPEPGESKVILKSAKAAVSYRRNRLSGVGVNNERTAHTPTASTPTSSFASEYKIEERNSEVVVPTQSKVKLETSAEDEAKESDLNTKTVERFKCRKCEQKFDSYLELALHLRKRVCKSNERWNSLLLSRSYSLKEFIPFTYQDKGQSSLRKYSCSVCGKYFFCIKDMYRHSLNRCGVARRNNYRCVLCPAGFKILFHLEAHCKVAHSGRPPAEKSFYRNFSLVDRQIKETTMKQIFPLSEELMDGVQYVWWCGRVNTCGKYKCESKAVMDTASEDVCGFEDSEEMLRNIEKTESLDQQSADCCFPCFHCGHPLANKKEWQEHMLEWHTPGNPLPKSEDEKKVVPTIVANNGISVPLLLPKKKFIRAPVVKRARDSEDAGAIVNTKYLRGDTEERSCAERDDEDSGLVIVSSYSMQSTKTDKLESNADGEKVDTGCSILKKGHACDSCGMTFSRASTLKSHVKLYHSGEADSSASLSSDDLPVYPEEVSIGKREPSAGHSSTKRAAIVAFNPELDHGMAADCTQPQGRRGDIAVRTQPIHKTGPRMKKLSASIGRNNASPCETSEASTKRSTEVPANHRDCQDRPQAAKGTTKPQLDSNHRCNFSSCGATFLTEEELARHLLIHNKMKFQDNVLRAPRKIGPALPGPSTNAQGKTIHKCIVCGGGFYERNDMVRHVEFCHTRQGRFACLICTCYYQNAMDLVGHMERDHDPASFEELRSASQAEQNALKSRTKNPTPPPVKSQVKRTQPLPTSETHTNRDLGQQKTASLLRPLPELLKSEMPELRTRTNGKFIRESHSSTPPPRVGQASGQILHPPVLTPSSEVTQNNTAHQYPVQANQFKAIPALAPPQPIIPAHLPPPPPYPGTSATVRPPFPCKLRGCGASFPIYGELKNHWLTAHPETNMKYICDFPNCGSPFAYESGLLSHLKQRKHTPLKK